MKSYYSLVCAGPFLAKEIRPRVTVVSNDSRAYFKENNFNLRLKLYTIYDYKNKKWNFTLFLHLILQNNMLFHIPFKHACIALVKANT